jgi:molybdate transport system substrate-binding protein
MTNWLGVDTHLPVWERKASESMQNADFSEAHGPLGEKQPAGSEAPVQIATLPPSRNRQQARRRAIVEYLVCALLAVCLSWNSAEASGQASTWSPELIVAAAADLSAALKEVAAEYEKKSGVPVKLSFGASGALTQQIQNGAPFDVFFSADMDYPRQLIAGGYADGNSPYQYAVGKLVLWVPSDSTLDVEHKGFNVLLNPSVKKISIANPEHAPYGRAAVAALKHAGLYDKVFSRLVLGENVSQAAQFVESGNAQAGFVALAHALAPGMQGKGRYWEVPADYYPPLAQGVVVLSHSPQKKEAEDFLEYIKTPEAYKLLLKYGFSSSPK